MKTIVISAVNLVEAGTLVILRDCLQYLSDLAKGKEYRIIAIVHKKSLVDFPNIEYIETQWPKKRWVNRLWFEYVSMKKISKDLGPVELWFSLHDTSPSVVAKRRAVYCHNSYSFYKWKMHDLLFAPKIAMFAIFTKLIYKTNIHKNNFLVVQQQWFRSAMSKMFDFDENRIIVAPPHSPKLETQIFENNHEKSDLTSFIFAGSPNSHKNFECICEAAHILENEMNIHNFKIFITVKGDENKYARWLFENWKEKAKSLNFIGFVTKETLFNYYEQCSCLIFPSKVETWGLPISEFANYQKPMLLADLPYAHETAEGSLKTAFFDPNNAKQLAQYMSELIAGNQGNFHQVPVKQISEPLARDWKSVFEQLLA